MAEPLGRGPVAQDQLADRPGVIGGLEQVGDGLERSLARPHPAARVSDEIARPGSVRRSCRDEDRPGVRGVVLDEPDRHGALEPRAVTAGLDPDEPPGFDEVVLHRNSRRRDRIGRRQDASGVSDGSGDSDGTGRARRLPEILKQQEIPMVPRTVPRSARASRPGSRTVQPRRRRVPTRPVPMVRPKVVRASDRASSRRRRCSSSSRPPRPGPGWLRGDPRRSCGTTIW